MTSPYWMRQGSEQGRVIPSRETAPNGSYVCCLGTDDPLRERDFMLVPGEEVAVRQSIVLETHRVINFSWRMWTPTLPVPRHIMVAGQAFFRDGDLIKTGDGLRGIEITPQGGAGGVFLNADRNHLCKVAGAAAANNGIYRISEVPVDQGDLIAHPGAIAVLENGGLVAGTNPAVTVTVLGLVWIVKAYLDGVLRAELIEAPGHDWARRSLAMHCSKFSGRAELEFVLRLEAVEPV